MILYPNAKINIGLNVLNKRLDGFHNISSAFYPIDLTDILEFMPSPNYHLEFFLTGIPIEGNHNDNLCVRVYQLFREKYQIPELKIHLHKNIPVQAGLGGGSSDAAFLIKGINTYFNLGLNNQQLKTVALHFGSDCPFFIDNYPAIASGRGELLEPFDLNLKNYTIIIIKPDIAISTAEAYSNIVPDDKSLTKDLFENFPMSKTSGLKNDFETFAFQKFPELNAIKETLLKKGAYFAQMTGSGSAIYGLFDKNFVVNPSDFPQAQVFVC